MASAEMVRQTLIIEISRKRVKRLYLGNTSDTNHSVILPDDVLDKILAFLPIKKAMQIGILSSRFNHSWIFSRRLHFDNDFARGRSPENFKSMVNKVFDQHAGSSILSFRLSFDANGEGFLVEKWIKKAIEELELFFYVIGINFEGGGPVKLISDVYDIESIKILKLSFCQLDLPLKFKGLHFLSTLVLRKITVTPTLIDNLFLNCLLLETLDIAQCYRIFHLKISTQNLKKFKELKVGYCPGVLMIDIDAPTLHAIHYCGHVCFIKFTNIPEVKDVMLNFGPSKGFTGTFQVRNLVYDLYNIRVLTTTSTFLEGLTPKFMGGTLTEMQFSFWNLIEFHLIMEGAMYCNPYDFVSFPKNCQYLEKIFIDLNDFNFVGGPYWELRNRQAFEQSHKDELLLLKFLLGSAPGLEKLVLITPNKSRRVKVVTLNLQGFYQDIQSWKASPRVEIAVFEHSNDRSSVSPMHSKTWY
ncbi:putative FBD-associated F-box protein At1g61330 [Populus nigra]|uniref:putative FBD-associated F-box protein At1g61330 n=1 Tax=Populus nigra TaxID=3691 RepID=UPI002B26593A|nr:putative FBD-associated F-box protein At1g61330 [Populus nigra]